MTLTIKIIINNSMKYFSLLLLLIAYSGNGQNVVAPFQHLLDSTYQANKDAIGIMVHLESPNKNISWTSAVGFSNAKTKEIINPNQPALIASNTKTYIAVAILKLIESDQLSLDQSIKKLLHKKTRNKLRKAGYELKKINIRHLLSHTSGITDYVTEDYFAYVNDHRNKSWTRDEQISLSMNIADPEPIGKTFAYADINYLLLTEIIEHITKQPFYIAVRVLLNFKLLGLHQTWFIDLEKTPTNALPLVHQYDRKFDWDSYDLNPSWDLFGGGGLVSTTKDLALFFQYLFEGKIIEDSNILKLLYTYVLAKEQSNYCLGIRHLTFHGDSAYYHGGFWGTDVMYLPQLNTTISLFTLQKQKREINAPFSHEIIRIIKSLP